MRKATAKKPTRSGEVIELSIVEDEKWKKKVRKSSSDAAIKEYLLNSIKGEKKWEAGIKYWFESNVVGYTTENGDGRGAADGYAPGWLVVELKSKREEWLEGFFEGLCRKELSFQVIVVACHNTLMVFHGRGCDTEDWPKSKVKLWKELLSRCDEIDEAPSTIGKILAKEYKKRSDLILNLALYEWSPENDHPLFHISQDEDEAIESFKKLVTSYDPKKARIEITTKNFDTVLKSLINFFPKEENCRFEVVHGFFRCINYWNQSYPAIIAEEPNEQDRVYMGAGYFEKLIPEARESFAKAIQRYEVLNPDKARFYAHYDLAIDAVDPKYRANHGIYFTNEYLARLAITLAERHIGSIAEKYIVFDPACGSGNLVTSWNHHLDLKHKVVSEISPVLLKAFELRFQGKSTERKKGLTIIPKTSSGEGLNFVDQDASSYLTRINKELKGAGYKLNKPLAIICNPPYRNQKDIKDDFYKYDVHESLIKVGGAAAGTELFVAFLAQISEICRQAEEGNFPPNSIVILFTKSIWLTGKDSFKTISKHFLSNFEERMGFVVDSREFFDVKQSWPLLCSLWEYKPNAGLNPSREINFDNYTSLKRVDLKDLANDKQKDFDDLSGWGTDDIFKKKLVKYLDGIVKTPIKFNAAITKLKSKVPPQAGDGNTEIGEDLIERECYVGGLCFASEDQLNEREDKFIKRIKPTYEKRKLLESEIEAGKAPKKTKLPKLPSFKVNGHPDGFHVGFTEGKQPFRAKRPYTNDGTSLYFMLDTRFMKLGTSQCFSGVPTTRGHVANGLSDAEKNLFIGYAMSHALMGHMPIEFDQFDMWIPKGDKNKMRELFELCAAFTILYNSCLECEIPKDHPYKGGNRIFVVNPLSPLKNTFFSNHLSVALKNSKQTEVVKALDVYHSYYKTWGKWISDNQSYKAKSQMYIYSHAANKIPSDGWGIFQIESEIKQLNYPALETVSEKRREVLKALKAKICNKLVELDYWSQT